MDHHGAWLGKWLAMFTACALLPVFVSPRAARADTAELQVFVDNEPGRARGCEVSTVDGPVRGVDLRARLVLDLNVKQVVSATVERCLPGASNRFGDTQVLDSVATAPWAIARGNGVDGSDLIEGYIPLSWLPASGALRLGAVLSGSAGEDALIDDAGPLELVLGLQPLPVLGLGGLLAASLAFVRRRVRGWSRRALSLMTLLVLLLLTPWLARAAFGEGTLIDWPESALIGTDPSADAAPSLDLRALYGQRSAADGVMYVRVDAALACTPSSPSDCPATGITDSDGDGLDDLWEVAHFGDLTADGSGDLDRDGLTDAQEFQQGLDPELDDAYEDADGDRYPNLFEVLRGSDARAADSTPSPDYIVNEANAGVDPNDNVYANVQTAVAAANAAGKPFAIVLISGGVHRGPQNAQFYLYANQARLLLLGEAGAGGTTIDAEGSNAQWYIDQRVAISGLSLRNFASATALQFASASASGSRLTDLVVTRVAPLNGPLNGVLRLSGAVQDIELIGSTLFDNGGSGGGHVLRIDEGAQLTIRNSLLWNPAATSGEVIAGSRARVRAHHSIIRYDPLDGEQNVLAVVDPLLRADGHLLPGSPAIGRAGAFATSQLDLDLEPRGAARDIGADQFVDSDLDALPDTWELRTAGDLQTLTTAVQDPDADGLDNAREYALATDPTLSDSDGDGAADGREVSARTDPLRVDSDADGMPDGYELDRSFDPLRDDAYDDADGDRYPNVFEHIRGSDARSAGSVPAPNFVVDAARAASDQTDNIYESVQAAINAAVSSAKPYAIVLISAGQHTAAADASVYIPASAPKSLLLGEAGAGATVIDGLDRSGQWQINQRTVVSGLTLRGFSSGPALYFAGAEASGSRVIDAVITTARPSGALLGAVHVGSYVRDFELVGCTVFNNAGPGGGHGLRVDDYAQLTLRNSLVWNPAATNGELLSGRTAQVSAHHSLVRLDPVSGTDNVRRVADPQLRADGHLLPGSPAIARGGSYASSRLDMDLEPRAAQPDIGADMFVDTDADSLPDSWELQYVGSLDTLTAPSQDADADGLANIEEYRRFSDPMLEDSDGDGATDGREAQFGTDLLKVDSDGDGMPDGYELDQAFDPLHDDAFDDADGDRYPNVFEWSRGSDARAATSTPAADVLVNEANADSDPNDNVVASIQAAVTAAAGTDYAIVLIGGGVHTGYQNYAVYLSARPTGILLLGEAGAGLTAINAQNQSGQWYVNERVAISGLTLRNYGTSSSPIYLGGTAASGSHLTDLVITSGDSGSSSAAVVHVAGAAEAVEIAGCTVFGNRGAGVGLRIDAAAEVAVRNSIFWNPAAYGGEVDAAPNARASAHHSLIRFDPLAGEGNVTGVVNPSLRADGHLLPGSPAIGRAGLYATSRLDMDLESRAETLDIGADMFVDSDGDGLPDAWERAYGGSLEPLAASSQDADGDGLSNAQEYALESDPTRTDSDRDGAPDGLEAAYGSNLLREDTDADGLPDGYEIDQGFDVLRDDAFDDADGDRYPNVFEHKKGSDPRSYSAIPSADYLVDEANGRADPNDNVYESIQAAISAATAAGDAYAILLISAGTYTGTQNNTLYTGPSSPRFLLLGAAAAGGTVIDGERQSGQWYFNQRVAVSGLTLRGFSSTTPLYLSGAPSSGSRFSDLVITGMRPNGPLSGAIGVSAAQRVEIVGCTVFENGGPRGGYAFQVSSAAQVAVRNSLFWNPAAASGEVYLASDSTGTANHSIIRGDPLPGLANVTGLSQVLLRADAHLSAGSPAINRASSAVSSQLDMDLEPRAGTPDIGADEWVDSDGDGIDDSWERGYVGSITALGSPGDYDEDGLDDLEEYARLTDPTRVDTDGDSIIDGDEVAFGLDPNVRDVDGLDTDLNGDGLDDSVGLQLGIALTARDVDGDGIENSVEIAAGTDPFDDDTDDDCTPDGRDAFPLDATLSTLEAVSGDTSAPVIELHRPANAQRQ